MSSACVYVVYYDCFESAHIREREAYVRVYIGRNRKIIIIIIIVTIFAATFFSFASVPQKRRFIMSEKLRKLRDVTMAKNFGEKCSKYLVFVYLKK